MTWKLILLMKLQYTMSYDFNIYMNHQLCLWNRHVMSSQRWEKKLAWRQLCLRLSLPIGSCWSQNTSQNARNTARITSSRIFFQSWNKKKRDISGGSKVGLFTCKWTTQKVMMAAKSMKNSIRKASSALIIHLILLTWVHVTFGFLECLREKWEIGNSHSSRYSRPFDGDMEWPHFRRRPICVSWVTDPPQLDHRKQRGVLFWIKEKEWELTRETFPGHLIGKTYLTPCKSLFSHMQIWNPVKIWRRSDSGKEELCHPFAIPWNTWRFNSLEIFPLEQRERFMFQPWRHFVILKPAPFCWACARNASPDFLSIWRTSEEMLPFENPIFTKSLKM
jgi:hypothetical protein